MRRVPAAEGSLLMSHVPNCFCDYRINRASGEESKIIDARCIASYLVTDKEASNA